MSGNEQHPQPQGWASIFFLVQKGGKGAAFGVALGGIGLMGLGISSSISFRSPLAGAQSFCQGIMAVGIAIGLYSIASHSKAATDLYVRVEAEKRLEDPQMPSASSIPPIQREIDKQVIAARESGTVPVVKA